MALTRRPCSTRATSVASDRGRISSGDFPTLRASDTSKITAQGAVQSSRNGSISVTSNPSSASAATAARQGRSTSGSAAARPNCGAQAMRPDVGGLVAISV